MKSNSETGGNAPHSSPLTPHASLKGQRLAALFLLGCLLLNYPLFSLFAGAAHLFGMPLLYVYVFFAWALVIALMAIVVERSTD